MPADQSGVRVERPGVTASLVQRPLFQPHPSLGAAVGGNIGLSARSRGSMYAGNDVFRNVSVQRWVPVILTITIDFTGRRQTLRRGAWAFQQLIENPYRSERWSKWANKLGESQQNCPPQVYLPDCPLSSHFSFVLSSLRQSVSRFNIATLAQFTFNPVGMKVTSAALAASIAASAAANEAA